MPSVDENSLTWTKWLTTDGPTGKERRQRHADDRRQQFCKADSWLSERGHAVAVEASTWEVCARTGSSANIHTANIVVVDRKVPTSIQWQLPVTRGKDKCCHVRTVDWVNLIRQLKIPNIIQSNHHPSTPFSQFALAPSRCSPQRPHDALSLTSRLRTRRTAQQISEAHVLTADRSAETRKSLTRAPFPAPCGAKSTYVGYCDSNRLRCMKPKKSCLTPRARGWRRLDV
jgi:hypothetical protein